MTSTDKVLGSIAAIQTLIENFPMGILDMLHGKTYTSAFDFLIDALNACGVDTNTIIDYLIDEIYGLETKVEGGIQGLYDQVKSKAIHIDEQSEFLEKLEMSIKSILSSLLTAIFGCDAIPILPNYIFDSDGLSGFDIKGGNGLTIPIGAIDIFGLLGICPTSDDGQLYYAIEGEDKYYHKVLVPSTTYTETVEHKTATTTTTVVENLKEEVIKYTKQVSLVMQIVYECNGNGEDEVAWKFFIDEVKEYDGFGNLKSSETNIPIDSDINICVNYNAYGSNTSAMWEGTIKAGDTESMELFLCPKDLEQPPKSSKINYININNVSPSTSVNDTTWVYLNKDKSKLYCKACYDGGTHYPTYGDGHWNSTRRDRLMAWTSLWDNSENWGSNNLNETYISAWTKTYDVTENQEYDETITVPEVNYHYEYQICTLSEAKDSENICRVNYIPTSDAIDDTSCEYIVCYEGLNPNTLYKTMDMNSFIWYAINKGMTEPQIEYNHLMWDSRVSAAKIDIGRQSPSEWNEWYKSKNNFNSEFLYDADISGTPTTFISQSDPLYPIIQLEPYGTTKEYITIHIPSQKYASVKKRSAIIEGDTPPKRSFNASIYKYNWDYLMGIQILHPKMLIVGLCEYLLGFSLSTISSTRINHTKKIIEAKLQNAVKSVIEANDMEVEDCYMTFSNEDFNDMLEEMLMSRYNATKYGGETSSVRTHNVNDYISMLDGVNSSSSSAGNVTQITKLITSVTADPGTEGSISFGLQVSSDGNLLKKLLWAIAMPIIQAIFTPQVILLILINFELMGVVKINDFFGNDFGKILNLLLNKILGLVKSIVLYIKDMIIARLLNLFYEKVLPLLIKYELLLLMEGLEYWLAILKEALACLSTYKLTSRTINGNIDEVNYADIFNSQKNTPETTTSTC